jgi:hypothetical protein
MKFLNFFDFCGSSWIRIRNTACVKWIRIGFKADTDPDFYLNADPDPGSQTNADPGHEKYT